MTNSPSEDEERCCSAVRARLGGSPFWNPVIIESVGLGGGWPETDLVVLLRPASASGLYRLKTRLSDWDFPAAGLPVPEPEDWAAWVVDRIMEVVDASPGLPPPRSPGERVEVTLD